MQGSKDIALMMLPLLTNVGAPDMDLTLMVFLPCDE